MAPVQIRTSETTAIPAATMPSQTTGGSRPAPLVHRHGNGDIGFGAHFVTPASVAAPALDRAASALATSLASRTNRYRRTNS